MIELKDKRSLKAKHFLLDNGQKKAEIHTNPIHYFNKLGVGDGQVRFREFDWTLKEHADGGWYFEYNNFIPHLPQFADQTIGFRDVCEDKDAVVSFTPLCNHVEGRLVTKEQLVSENLDKLTDTNCVVYDNAFGEGIDLILYFKRLGLAKVVRMRTYENKDYEFSFNLGLPDNVTLKRKDTVTSYELLQEGSKVLDSGKQTAIVYANEEETYFRPFRAWSLTKDSVIPVEISFNGEDTRLTKKLSAELITSFNGDTIYTDATTTYYPSGDGWFGRQSWSNWSTFKNGSSGSDWGPTTTDDGLPMHYLQQSLKLFRHTYFQFDTSTIPDTDTISDATLSLYITAKTDSGSDSPDSVVVDGDGAITAGNFFNFGTTAYSNTIAYSSITTSAYNAFTLNSNGIANISNTGTSTFIVTNKNYFVDNVDPGSGNWEIDCGSVEHTGTSQDPKLDVTYAPTSNSAFFGMGI